jgi:hypothetical protein
MGGNDSIMFASLMSFFIFLSSCHPLENQKIVSITRCECCVSFCINSVFFIFEYKEFGDTKVVVKLTLLCCVNIATT